jgi:hypothetical protein
MKKPAQLGARRAREENSNGLDSQTATLLDHHLATHYDTPRAKPMPSGRGWRNAVVPAGRAQLVSGTERRAEIYAARLKAVRAQISAVLAAPYGYGSAGPHRRRRDEYILQALAADIHARLIETRAT